MQWLARMVAVLLLGALAAAQPGTQVLASSAGPPLSAAGCHGHMAPHGSVPAIPASPKYQCCVNGHHAAIPSAVFSGYRVLAIISAVDGGLGAAVRSPSELPSVLTLVSSSSPRSAPLRI